MKRVSKFQETKRQETSLIEVMSNEVLENVMVLPMPHKERRRMRL